MSDALRAVAHRPPLQVHEPAMLTPASRRPPAANGFPQFSKLTRAADRLTGVMRANEADAPVAFVAELSVAVANFSRGGRAIRKVSARRVPSGGVSRLDAPVARFAGGDA